MDSQTAVKTHPDAASNEKLVVEVKERYGMIAEGKLDSCCGPSPSPCGCGGSTEAIATSVGYSREDIENLSDANLGLGCGAPIEHLHLQPGERDDHGRPGR